MINFKTISIEKHLFKYLINDSTIYLNSINEIDVGFQLKLLEALRVFFKQKKILDVLLNSTVIDQMYWRASHPINNLLPLELQWSMKSNIGCWGDWFDLDGCRRVESAMYSSIRLAKILSWK